VAGERGWQPFHVTLHEGGELVGAAPLYVKGSSEGEFVFDQGWADFCQGRLGVRYYPKLLSAVPFTPATAPRLLVRDGADGSRLLLAFARGLEELTARLGLSSAHVLFPDAAQASALERAGLAHRHGVQYHWRNEGYATFEDFLSRFTSKRRNQIRREMRAPREQGLELVVRTGRDLTPELLDHAFDFYVSTVQKHFWGRQYLNRAFFEHLAATVPDSVLVVFALDGSGTPIAGAFNLLGPDALYGRYWGARGGVEHPFLHFNVCYYRGIEECITRGLRLFEPGAGGEHKLSRGFEPTVTHSLHHLADPRLDRAVRDFLSRERGAIGAHLDEYGEGPVLRRTPP
jgi:predicted N-acyltransferase